MSAEKKFTSLVKPLDPETAQKIQQSLCGFMAEFGDSTHISPPAEGETRKPAKYCFLTPAAFAVVTDPVKMDEMSFWHTIPHGSSMVVIKPSEDGIDHTKSSASWAIETLRQCIKNKMLPIGKVRINPEGLGPLMLVADSWADMIQGLNQLVGEKFKITATQGASISSRSA